MPTLTLSRKAIAGIPIPQSKAITYYDTATVGFGLKCLPNGKQRWIVEYRPGIGGRGVRQRRMVLGDARVVTIDEAREAARTILSKAHLGGDPAQDRSEERHSFTVAELVQKYLQQHVHAKKKQTTEESFKQVTRNYIVPEFGSKRASGIGRADVARWHREIGTTKPATANRALAVLSAAYAYGLRYGYLKKMENPAKGVEHFRESPRERFLTADELTRLGETLRLAETEGLPWRIDGKRASKHWHKRKSTVIDPFAVAAIRLLMLTGARKNEVLSLEWKHVDLERGLINLPDSKTGKKTILLGGAAIEVLLGLPRIGDMVIAGRDAEKARVDLKKPWDRIREHAGLGDLRIHDLRHSFAAISASSGLGMPVIAKMLGHKNLKTTQRYAHLADDPLRRATDAVSATIAEALRQQPKAN